MARHRSAESWIRLLPMQASVAFSILFLVQSQRCHSNECPVGITTQDPRLNKALVVEDKAQRVYRYHKSSVEVLNEIVAAAGLDHPTGLRPDYVYQRTGPTEVKTLEEIYQFLKPGELVDGTDHPIFAKYWKMSTAESFHPGNYANSSNG